MTSLEVELKIRQNYDDTGKLQKYKTYMYLFDTTVFSKISVK